MTARIVTLTLNPALDMACFAQAVRPTHKIRTTGEHLDPGGGGINVARVMHALGGDAQALVMTGGPTGQMIEELLNETGVPWRALPVRGRSRISLNVHEQETGLEYRFVPEGPLVEPDEWAAALTALEQIEADWIVASGSLPRGVPVDFYARAAAIARRRGQTFVLDTSGPALHAATAHGVDLLKMSLGELAFLAGRPMTEPSAQQDEVAALLRSGAARTVAISQGAEGAFLGSAAGFVRLPALPVDHRGAVGAGDAFLGGLILGLTRGWPGRQALGFALAAGAAAVSTHGTARIDRADVESRYQAWCQGNA